MSSIVKLKKNENIKENLHLNKTQLLEKYTQNKMQINCIKQVLIEHSDVPEKLVDWLIQSVEENTIIENKYM